MVKARYDAQYFVEYYQQHRKVMIGRSKDRWRVSRIRIDAIKLESGCVDCGYREHPQALQFDHVDPSLKQHEIGRMTGMKWSRIEAEIAKCQVRCANCHAVRTHAEGHSSGTITRRSSDPTLFDATGF